MIDWLHPLVPLFKAAHIIALIIWLGGLLALPLLLALHDPVASEGDYTSIRRGSHLTYVMVVTPAAVLAVIAGTWLVFMREVFTPWMFAKLLGVAVLAFAHVWIGNLVVKVGEEPETHKPISPIFPLTAVCVPALLILTLVLAKPDLSHLEWPEWASQPQERQLPFDVPIR